MLWLIQEKESEKEGGQDDAKRAGGGDIQVSESSQGHHLIYLREKEGVQDHSTGNGDNEVGENRAIVYLH